MSEDSCSYPEREMKDFQFRQMKKIRVFEPPDDLPKDRSNLLVLSNKYGLTFVALDRIIKVYHTADILAADKVDGSSNKIVEGIPVVADVDLELPVHHLALSCDELTLSVCGIFEVTGLSLGFYDIRTFVNKTRPQKLPFASMQPAVGPGVFVQDLKWNPAQASLLAVCLSDGSMMILDVNDSVGVQATLPAVNGITCICWSPKGKQVAAGKMNATVSQYTPVLEEKKVIPCPSFYSPDNPVKVLDVLWLRTFVFAVVYAAADGSPETPPELVVITIPRKEERVETQYVNFGDLVYGTCTERQHRYFLSHIEDWDVVFASSAASTEVSVIAKQEDKNNWELWLLEDASRADLPVTVTNEDTLPLGLAIDFTSQQEIHISDEKILPPAPIMVLLSTDGLLCPFAVLNHNPGAKPLISAPTYLAIEGERLPKAGSLAPPPTKSAASTQFAPASFPALCSASAVTSAPLHTTASSSSAPLSIASSAPAISSSGFTFSIPTTTSVTASSAFPLGDSVAFSSGSSGFSFTAKPLSEAPSAPSPFSFSIPSFKSSTVATLGPTPASTPQSLGTPSSSALKLSLNDRSSVLETLPPSNQLFSISSSVPKTEVSDSSSLTTPPFSGSKTPAMIAPIRPVQTSTTPTVVQKPTPASQSRNSTPQAAVNVKALEKQLHQKKDTDPIMAAMLEEIAHFQKELADFKTKSMKHDFKVGTSEEMKTLRKESEDFHIFTLEIKETTESLHGDIGILKTTLLEGFEGLEEANSQNELSKSKQYWHLLCKKPLDPRSEEQLKEIRKLYQYVNFTVDDVNDVLDAQWENHVEKKKTKCMVVPWRHRLFSSLSNNYYIINQQKSRLDQLIQKLTSLCLYNKPSTWLDDPPHATQSNATATPASMEAELAALRDALLKTRLDNTPSKTEPVSPVKISSAKQSQLRNFLSKGRMPPVRSTAPANLSRSAFLSTKYYEDLDDVSSTSSLSQSLEPHPAHLELEEEEIQSEFPVTSLPPALSTPRHPTVVRTPSIQPGFGAIQSTPLPKVHSVQGMGFGLSPIANPVPTSKINLSAADSTALVTKTVKHGAPLTEKTIPVTISAQQAAATAALRRQMASQKPATVSASLTESTLKTVPQVVNVQELKDKGPALPISTVISSSVPDPAASVFQQVLAAVSSNQAKRNPSQGISKVPFESISSTQPSFVFGDSSKADASVIPATSVEQSNSKSFSFSSPTPNFSFTSVAQGAGTSQVKDVNKFSFGGSGKMVFGQTADQPFSFVPKSGSSGQSTGSFTLSTNSSADAARPSSSTAALRIEPQPSKAVGGETLGSFSGLRVSQGEEVKDLSTKVPADSFSFSDSGLSVNKGSAQFTFRVAPQKPVEDSTTADLSKEASSDSLFKPPESNAQLAFSVPQSNSNVSGSRTSFSSLLAAPSDSAEESKTPVHPSEPTPPPEPEPATEPAVGINNPSVLPDLPTVTNVGETTVTAVRVSTVSASLAKAAPNVEPSSAIPPPAETTAPTTSSAAPATEPTSDIITATASVPASASTTPSVETASQAPSPAFQVATFDKPGSIFTQPATVTTDSSSISVTPVINTVAPLGTTTTPTTVNSTTTAANTVFGQPAVAPASSAPAPTGFGSAGFGTPTGSSFGKSVFGQVGGFGQPNSNTGTASGFSFGQSVFGGSSGSTTTGGGNIFGASTPNNASSFSFGTSSANTACTTSTSLFGQNAAPAFGQQGSVFGQNSVFGSKTTTSSSTGFSFGQPSVFGCSSAAPVFAQQPNSGSLFGQQPSASGNVFGSSSTNTANSSSAGGFFSGLGGKPNEEAANKNPFGTTASPGAFGQSAQTGTNSLFGSSGAKTFGFGQSSFGDQKPSGTFSTGGGSVASQGFGSFSTPTKPGGFGSAPVFGSPPSFGGSPAFGGAAAFGSGPSFSSSMGSSPGKVFGEGTAAANVGGFGFASPSSAPSFGSLASQNAPSFGSLAQQGSGFGSQPSSFSGFGQQPQGGGFSGSGFGSSNQPTSQTFGGWRS